jgi:hypothetical protein
VLVGWGRSSCSIAISPRQSIEAQLAEKTGLLQTTFDNIGKAWRSSIAI